MLQVLVLPQINNRIKNAKTKHAARKPALLRNGATNSPRHTKLVAIPNSIGN
jgi:hypothetical protein